MLHRVWCPLVQLSAALHLLEGVGKVEAGLVLMRGVRERVEERNWHVSEGPLAVAKLALGHCQEV